MRFDGVAGYRWRALSPMNEVSRSGFRLTLPETTNIFSNTR